MHLYSHVNAIVGLVVQVFQSRKPHGSNVAIELLVIKIAHKVALLIIEFFVVYQVDVLIFKVCAYLFDSFFIFLRILRVESIDYLKCVDSFAALIASLFVIALGNAIE